MGLLASTRNPKSFRVYCKGLGVADSATRDPAERRGEPARAGEGGAGPLKLEANTVSPNWEELPVCRD